MILRTLNVTAIGAGLVFAATTATAVAQDWSLNPTYGSVNLTNGFAPDPHRVRLSSGGPIDASSSIGGNCRGFVADAPDYRVNYTAGSWPLIFNVESGSDTTLVVNGPDGRWYCDDDGGDGLNPRFEWGSPPSGQYDVYVGTYGGATLQSATLLITELRTTTAPPVNSPSGPDWSMAPTYGSVSLRAGFAPDPYSVSLQSGGPFDASTAIGEACRGFIAEAPDYRVTYTAGSWPLIFTVDSHWDTTLVVNGPDGRWYCDDDGGDGLDPRLEWGSPPSGQYDVYVGTYGRTSALPATLLISELSDTQVPPPNTSNGPDWSLAPTYGSVSLRAGFTPDPHNVQIRSGGPFDASSAIDSSCRGYIAEAPDFRVNYTAGSWPLIFSVAASADTTLVVNGPDGLWYCDDDSGQGFNPSLRWNSPPSGQYDVYVGTYGSATTQPATLAISEIRSN